MYSTLTIFSERERALFAVARPSVCRLSVCLSATLVRPTQAVQIFGNISTALGKISPRSSQGNPSAGGVNTRGLAKYIAILDLSTAISRKRCKIGGIKLLLGP